jgi:hypothetical protein
VQILHYTVKMSNDDDRQMKQREAGERETARLWRAWRTVHEMVQDRGYELSDEEVKITLDEFKSKFGGADGSIEYAPTQQHSQVLLLTNCQARTYEVLCSTQRCDD